MQGDEIALAEQVAKALLGKGVSLGALGRSEEAIAVYDELEARYGERDEIALAEAVARALLGKGVTLGTLGQSEEAIAVYDEVEARYDERDEIALAEQVAWALVNKGARLGALGRSEYGQAGEGFGLRAADRARPSRKPSSAAAEEAHAKNQCRCPSSRIAGGTTRLLAPF